MDRHFRIGFGRSYNEFSKVLRESRHDVIDSFANTVMHKDFIKYYSAAIPQVGERPMDFIIRNHRKSYVTESQKNEQEVDYIMAKFAWQTGKIPLIRRIIRMNNFSTELYLGQESTAIRDEIDQRNPGIGNDRLGGILTNIASNHLVNIDVGFHSDTKGKKPDWFYQINALDMNLHEPSEVAYRAVLHHKHK